jgi:putative transcriptional regulator
MSINYHPGDEFLVAYAAGDLAEAWSLLVATHIALCPSCRSRAADAETMGGVFLSDEEPVEMSAGALDATLQRAMAMENEPAPPPAVMSGGKVPVLPQPLRGYAGADIDGLRWRPLGRNAKHIPLVSGQDGTVARLLRIPAGKPVPEHGHNGVELTMVLSGSFAANDIQYSRGDVETADAEIEHQPVAAPGVDCICLAVTDAPLRFRGVFARLVQPLIGI